jgi:hypothetical protein
MEVVQGKYNNFIVFLKENINNPTYITLLSTASLERFLTTLNNEQGTPQEITKKLC